METEETKQPVEEPETKPEEKPVSVVELAREIRDEIVKSKEELRVEREKLEKVQSENLLSSTAGVKMPEEEKEETPQEYKDRVMRGEQ